MKLVFIDNFKVIKRKFKPNLKKSQTCEIRYLKSNISLAKIKLEFKSKFSLKSGIKAIIENQYKLSQ